MKIKENKGKRGNFIDVVIKWGIWIVILGAVVTFFVLKLFK